MKLYVKESEDVTYERNQATDFMTSVLDIIKDIAGILPKHVEYKEYPQDNYIWNMPMVGGIYPAKYSDPQSCADDWLNKFKDSFRSTYRVRGVVGLESMTVEEFADREARIAEKCSHTIVDKTRFKNFLVSAIRPEDIINIDSTKEAENISESISWISNEELESALDSDNFEDIWETYLSGPEDEVNKKYNIFPEPSVQGGYGSIFIFDQSNKKRKNKPITLDYQDWCEKEYKLASESNSVEEYKHKYNKFISNILKENGWNM